MALLALLLATALLATGGLALLALRGGTPVEPEPEVAAGKNGEGAQALVPSSATLHAYRTTATLTEDLRDALADPAADLDREWRRVSAALQDKARWTLHRLVPEEASPRVRALLILCAGIHEPESKAVLDRLNDREPVVRKAAALTIAYQEEGRKKYRLLNRVPVPIGRKVGPAALQALEKRLKVEKDEAARMALTAVLATQGG
jgi:hypothetical protein